MSKAPRHPSNCSGHRANASRAPLSVPTKVTTWIGATLAFALAGLALGTGLLVAFLLPEYHCVWKQHPVNNFFLSCSGVGVKPRLAIALEGAAVAVPLLLAGPRALGQARTTRGQWFVGAGLVLAMALSAAVLLPHSCGWVAVGCAPGQTDCGRYCTGLGLPPRLAIAFAGLAVASMMLLLGRRARS